MVPARHREQDPRLRRLPGPKRGGVPLIDPVADFLAVSLVEVFKRVVDDAQVEAHAGDAAADPGRAIAAPPIDDLEQIFAPERALGTSGGRIGARSASKGMAGPAQSDARKDSAEHRAVDDSLAVPAHAFSQVGAVRAGDDVAIGKAAKEIGGQPPRHEFALTVPGRHEDHQPEDIAADQHIQIVRQNPVRLRHLEVRHGLHGKDPQAVLGLSDEGNLVPKRPLHAHRVGTIPFVFSHLLNCSFCSTHLLQHKEQMSGVISR